MKERVHVTFGTYKSIRFLCVLTTTTQKKISVAVFSAIFLSTLLRPRRKKLSIIALFKDNLGVVIERIMLQQFLINIYLHIFFLIRPGATS